MLVNVIVVVNVWFFLGDFFFAIHWSRRDRQLASKGGCHSNVRAFNILGGEGGALSPKSHREESGKKYCAFPGCGAPLGGADTLKMLTILRGNSSVLANDELGATSPLAAATADLR